MNVDFDHSTGDLVLDDEAIEWLLLLQPDDAVPDVFATAGVFDGDELHPLVGPLVQALRRPLCQLRAAVRTPTGVVAHEMWLTPGLTAALLPLPNGSRLTSLDTDFVPAALARAFEVRPRPHIAGNAFDVPGGLVDALLAGEKDAPTVLAERAPTEWSACASAWRRGDWRLWTAEASWPDSGRDGGVGARAVTVLDTPSGLAIIELAAGDRARLVPSTSTHVWRRLVALLPTDDEAARAAVSMSVELSAG